MYTYKAKVIRILDGDTFEAEVDLGFSIIARHIFRVEGIDTPETWRPRNEKERQHGLKATARATELLLTDDIIIKTHKHTSIYGRYSARVSLSDGRDFTNIMLKEGFQKLDEY